MRRLLSNILMMPKYVLICLLFISTIDPTLALDLNDVLEKFPSNEIFPNADRVEQDNERPTIAKVYKGSDQIGLVYLNAAIVNSTGYSGKPINVLIGLDMKGVIRSVRLVEHHEPIILIGIPESKVTAVIDSYIGMDIVALTRSKERKLPYDALSGATVTVRVIDDSIVRSAIKVARWYGLGGLKVKAKKTSTTIVEIDKDQNEISDWVDLLSNGSVKRLKLTEGDVNEAFAKEAAASNKQLQTGEENPEGEFIELYTALVSIPTIGRSLLGDAEYKNLVASLNPGQHAIMITANGPYSFKGSGYVRGGIFDRFEVVQNDNAIRFRDIHNKRLRKIAANGAPELQDVDLFKIPADIEFNPVQPWFIELLVSRETGPRSKLFTTFDLHYQTPEHYLKTIEQKAENIETSASVIEESLSEETPLWKLLWQDKLWQLIVLLLALTLLTWIFFFQIWLVQHPRLLSNLRLGFMLFTLFGIGFYANAQLSVVNIFTVINALATGFDWGYFLMDPLIFTLWGSVATALLFWGRGAYCGWLCPFGALQELLNKAAKAFKIPQITVPWGIHERLWALKYIIFLVLFGVSLHSLDLAERLAEVEPFKTAIILKFVREWPFVLFAIAILSAGLFIERFYCRYLCPLGAALAIPARLRMFEWLKRYRQCGNPCQQCSNECMVQAIHPEGQINPNECIYCQHCQQLYYDDHRCPVVLQQRLKRERRESKASASVSGVAENILRDIRQNREETVDE
jgi:NosR/NirI family transcriptional regulator, nitrous oxide reductase regulator